MNLDALETYSSIKSHHYLRTYLAALFLEFAIFIFLKLFGFSPVGQQVLLLIMCGVVVAILLYPIKQLRPFQDWIYLLSSLYFIGCWSMFPVWDDLSTPSMVAYFGCLITFTMHCTLLDKRPFIILAIGILISTIVLPFSIIYIICLLFIFCFLRFALGIIQMKRALNSIRLQLSLMEFKLQSQRYWGHHLLNPLAVISGHFLLNQTKQIDEGKQKRIIVASMRKMKIALDSVDRSDLAFDSKQSQTKVIESPYVRPEWGIAILALIYPIILLWDALSHGFKYHPNSLIGSIAVLTILSFPLIQLKASRKYRTFIELAFSISLQVLISASFLLSDRSLIAYICFFGGLLSSILILARGERKIILVAGLSASLFGLVTSDVLISTFIVGYICYLTYQIYSSIVLNHEFMQQHEVLIKSKIILESWDELKDDITPRINHLLEEAEVTSASFDWNEIKLLVDYIEDAVRKISEHDSSISVQEVNSF